MSPDQSGLLAALPFLLFLSLACRSYAPAVTWIVVGAVFLVLA